MDERGYRIACGCYTFIRKALGRVTTPVATEENFTKCTTLDLKLGVGANDCEDSWMKFIEHSIIPDGSENSGLHYAGFISEDIHQWCLPSWIWTNAATVSIFCTLGNESNIAEAKRLGDILISKQQECGGWIVRNDYEADGAHPILAPNDSAYIANNAMLSLYNATKDDKYLISARRCADWIMATARDNGMVYLGQEMKTGQWKKRSNIVDTGFTAGLFANLFEATGEEEYKDYLLRFLDAYIKLFYIPSKKGFATSIMDDKQMGGMFGRGQAWALEGLIPAYRVLMTEKLKTIIAGVIDLLIAKQHKKGGWAYNLTREFLGEDCKAIPVIAKNMMDWNEICPEKRIIESAQKALNWCRDQTATVSEAEGGIFSFCMEGAIVHHLNTSTAFVYASAYAIELSRQLKAIE